MCQIAREYVFVQSLYYIRNKFPNILQTQNESIPTYTAYRNVCLGFLNSTDISIVLGCEMWRVVSVEHRGVPAVSSKWVWLR